jgi:hypothetical protein
VTNILQAERDPDEEGDYMAFEQLMAEAAKKQEKKKDKETPTEKKKEKDHAHHHSHYPFASSAKPPEGMSEAEAKERAHMAGQDPNAKR